MAEQSLRRQLSYHARQQAQIGDAKDLIGIFNLFSTILKCFQGTEALWIGYWPGWCSTYQAIFQDEATDDDKWKCVRVEWPAYVLSSWWTW
jgi:hypothetical protein